MQMMDMKLPKKSKKEMEGETSVPPPGGENQERYPYGLRLRFENEQFDKLDMLSDLKVGDKVTIHAMATVTERRESERQGKEKDRSCEIQIENIGIEGGKKPSKMSREELEQMSDK